MTACDVLISVVLLPSARHMVDNACIINAAGWQTPRQQRSRSAVSWQTVLTAVQIAMRCPCQRPCRERRSMLMLDLQLPLQHTASSCMSQGSPLRTGLRQAARAQQGCRLMACVPVPAADCPCAHHQSIMHQARDAGGQQTPRQCIAPACLFCGRAVQRAVRVAE